MEGIIFVTVIVFLFMADWRTTLIVSLVIPLALLFAFMCLKLKGMSANLLSMGAIDFGIIIDAAVVMVERGRGDVCDRTDTARRELCLAFFLKNLQGRSEQGSACIHLRSIAPIYSVSIALLYFRR